MKRLYQLLSCVFFLTLGGCLPAVIVAGTATASTIIYDNRSFKTMNQDRHATETAQTLIDHDKKLHGHSHISVTTFNHRMLMVGQVETSELREYAYQLIDKNIKGLRRLTNEVTVAGSSSLIQRSNDAWITTKVKAAMLTKKSLHSTEIKVVTESSVVYLLGLVSRRQAVLATEAARCVPGVLKVVKVFEYT